MSDVLAQNLRKVEKAMVKLKNNLNRADIDYTVQASISSTDPTVTRYAAQMTPPANGLAPITFIAASPEELVEKIKLAAKGINYKTVEIAYHKGQIEACKRTIQGHEERITEVEKEDDDATEAVAKEIEEQASESNESESKASK